jgi:hypothetical protein
MESFANPFIQIMFILTMVVISLAGISVRIQKGNKLQKKSIEQSLVKTDAKYSELGIFRQGDRTVIKCPSCAEFISIEAKICKNCQSNVEKHVADLTRKMKELDEDQSQFLVEQREISEKKREEQSQKFKKNLPKIALVVIIGTFFGVLKFADNKAKINTKKIQEKLVALYPRDMELIANSWDKILSECGFEGVKVTKYYDSRSLYSYDSIEITYEQLGIQNEDLTGMNLRKNKNLNCLEAKLRAFYADFNRRKGVDESPNANFHVFYRNGVGVLANEWKEKNK